MILIKKGPTSMTYLWNIISSWQKVPVTLVNPDKNILMGITVILTALLLITVIELKKKAQPKTTVSAISLLSLISMLLLVTIYFWFNPAQIPNDPPVPAQIVTTISKDLKHELKN